MAIDVLTLAKSKKYTDLVALGLASATVDDVNKSITFTLTADGSQHTIHFSQPSDGQDGISVTGVSDKGNGIFTLLFSDGSESDPIQTVKGQKGDKGDKLTFNDLTDAEKDSLKGSNGFSPTITENADNTDKIYKLDITTADSTFTTPNLKGADGTGGEGASKWSEISEKPFESLSTDFSVENGELKVVGGTGGSGEENVIESIKVNGVTQTVAADKSVDITVPTKTSDLSNDSGFLTEHQDLSGYVEKEDGKGLSSNDYTTEEKDKLAGLENYDDTQVNADISALSTRVKTVEDDYVKSADIPTKVSDLTNDSNYQTADDITATLAPYAKSADVTSEITTEIAKIVADAPEDLNTLKEMSDWIAGHENDASAMNSAIQKNKTNIETLQTDKADESELTAHTENADIHVTADQKTKWDKAEENTIGTIKVNGEEVTPDENKAINIDLTGYAEHDEIIGENLIPYPYAQPNRTTNGITFTIDESGIITANGTATADADFSVCVRTNFGTDDALMLNAGTYAISGCPEGGSDSTYRVHVQFGDKDGVKHTLKADYGKGFVFEVTEEYAQYACQIQCHVQKGYTVTDLVFKPMLVYGSITREYQPYKLSRQSIRDDVDTKVNKADILNTTLSDANECIPSDVGFCCFTLLESSTNTPTTDPYVIEAYRQAKYSTRHYITQIATSTQSNKQYIRYCTYYTQTEEKIFGDWKAIGVIDDNDTTSTTSTLSAKAISDKFGTTDISDIGDGTVTGAISAVNDVLNQIGNCELIKEVSGSTSYNWNIKDLSKYSWLTFSYSSNFITVPYLVFKTVGSCIVKLGSIANNANMIATFTYVSDTNITISTSQGSMVRLFGIK